MYLVTSHILQRNETTTSVLILLGKCSVSYVSRTDLTRFICLQHKNLFTNELPGIIKVLHRNILRYTSLGCLLVYTDYKRESRNPAPV